MERDQALQLRDALELAYCQPAVGAFFNFQLVDEEQLGGWQSGLLWADGSREALVRPFKAAVAAWCGKGRLRALPRLHPRRGAGGWQPSSSILAGVLRAVVFDVDFTLARPGPTSGRTATASSASATGSTSTRRATSRRAPPLSPR